MSTFPLSVLDLAIVGRDETVADSLAGSVRMAQRAEALGYSRVWYAEHHNMSSIASSATAVLIAHVAATDLPWTDIVEADWTMANDMLDAEVALE